jgi:hypothetical protein
MKLKLFNGTLISLSLQVITGGYDPEQGCTTFVVRGYGEQAGTLQMSVPEAVKFVGLLSNLPKVEKVVE